MITILTTKHIMLLCIYIYILLLLWYRLLRHVHHCISLYICPSSLRAMWPGKQDLVQVQWQMDGSHGNTSDKTSAVTVSLQSPDRSDSESAVQLKPSSNAESRSAAKNVNEYCMWRKVKKRERTLYQYSASKCQTGWRPSSGTWPLCLLLASSHCWRLIRLIKRFQHVSTCSNQTAVAITCKTCKHRNYSECIRTFAPFYYYTLLILFPTICKNKSAISCS